MELPWHDWQFNGRNQGIYRLRCTKKTAVSYGIMNYQPQLVQDSSMNLKRMVRIGKLFLPTRDSWTTHSSTSQWVVAGDFFAVEVLSLIFISYSKTSFGAVCPNTPFHSMGFPRHIPGFLWRTRKTNHHPEKTLESSKVHDRLGILLGHVTFKLWPHEKVWRTWCKQNTAI